MLALFRPAVLRLFTPLSGLFAWESGGPAVYPRFDSMPSSWLAAFVTSVFVTSVFCGPIAGLMAGRFTRSVLVSLGVVGTLMIVQSAWFGASVLWRYPWNGLLTFTRWGVINASIASLFLGGLYLGGWPRIQSKSRDGVPGGLPTDA